MPDDLDPRSLDPAATGSIGSQTPASPAEASAILSTVPPGTPGLTPITTAEQLAELAKSGLPAEVKSEMLSAMLVGAQQHLVADLRHRVEVGEKELVRVRRQLSDAKSEAAELQGDVRVRDEQIGHLKSHRNRDAFLMFISSVLFGVGGAYVGRSAAAAAIGFGAGIALAMVVWFHPPSDTGFRP